MIKSHLKKYNTGKQTGFAKFRYNKSGYSQAEI